jgi:ATP-dependent helicase/nuclease subunit A
VLVDEFQDTDPVQAEVLLLLTAGDVEERSWQRSRPRPGAFFAVGDPKQSIYRFRRADIVTYEHVKAIIAAHGRVVQLSANFRAAPPVARWINDALGDAFPAQSTPESPVYVPLWPARQVGCTGELTGVAVLRIPPEHARGRESVIAHEADRIARTIRRALDERASVSRSPQELAMGRGPAVAPDDFLIIARRRRQLGSYARALQSYGIPCRVSGGSVLNEVESLGLLHVALAALLQPDNPVALVAALRSELLGISDAAFYAFSKAGGVFSILVPPSAGPPEVVESIELLRRCSELVLRLPPLVAVEQVAADLGLFALAAAHPGGELEAGSFAKAFEVLRRTARTSWSVEQLWQHLGEIVARRELHDGTSARAEGGPAVRVMNLHRAKGLEAPVVFLAFPPDRAPPPVQLWVDRTEERVRGHLAVYEREQGGHWRLLAHPPRWAELAAREERFRAAEELRLRYVAATRASSLLVISAPAGAGQRSGWCLPLADLPEFPDPGPQQAPQRHAPQLPAGAAAAAAAAIRERRASLVSPSYGETDVTSPAMGPPQVDDDDGVVPVAVQRAARSAALEATPLWPRARAVEKRLVGVPWQLLAEEGGPLLLRGELDLAFREPSGWVLVQLAGDAAKPLDDPAALLDEQAPRLRRCAEAWAQATGEPVVEAHLCLAGTDRCVRVR